jgi:hypothetical protein
MIRTAVVLLTLPILAVEPAPNTQLLAIRRIHVERLSGGDMANHLRGMLIAALQRTGLYTLTEDASSADAVLRGSAEDLVFSESSSYADGISAREQIGVGSASTRSGSGRLNAGASVSDRESSRSIRRRHEAAAAVRLIAKNGDVIWSTTQESLGAKFRGASADVAAKIAGQLLQDHERAKRREIE